MTAWRLLLIIWLKHHLLNIGDALIEQQAERHRISMRAIEPRELLQETTYTVGR